MLESFGLVWVTFLFFWVFGCYHFGITILHGRLFSPALEGGVSLSFQLIPKVQWPDCLCMSFTHSSSILALLHALAIVSVWDQPWSSGHISEYCHDIFGQCLVYLRPTSLFIVGGLSLVLALICFVFALLLLFVREAILTCCLTYFCLLEY